ncbi:MAG: zf-HC2 domain-containing protein [Candidatus Eremiobacteraeota bacterium]|nr:zf-HC2 domain-containing protein [Candidatus Eremiobacteraeota bacterium]
MKKTMMEHATNEQLIDYIHSQLTPDQDARMHAHLADCSRCRDEYEVEAQLSEMLRNQAALEELELPSMVKANIWAAVREALPSPMDRLRTFLRPVYAVPVAAALLIALFFAPGYLHRSSSAPTIDAAFFLEDHRAMGSLVPFADHSGAMSSEFEASPTDQTAVNPVPVVMTADANR